SPHADLAAFSSASTHPSLAPKRTPPLGWCLFLFYEECSYFSFISERKVPKETPRETHGFTTYFSALHPTHNDTAPRVNFCGENLAEM
ncbi:MAG: hypothetical protein IJO41_04390, partial [Oscillospiraceae bacterium]|nr:hypothetical protein [Oscillospiraceae bacterium]